MYVFGLFLVDVYLFYVFNCLIILLMIGIYMVFNVGKGGVGGSEVMRNC